ncbi:Transcription factor IIIB 50 kDa subunit [Blastocladiella emersonii ATCC 22665]|nr:Transcription factor IIIB 50 kDa subunit [Blastocladiella emersonii ATCC 22665]
MNSSHHASSRAPGCPSCGAPASDLEEADAQVVCTQCGAVLDESMVTTEADQGIFVAGFAGTVRMGPGPPSRPGRGTDDYHERQRQRAMRELRGTVLLLGLEAYWPSIRDSAAELYRTGTFRWGLPARLVGAAVAILVTRHAAAIPLSRAAAVLRVDRFLLGTYVHSVRHSLGLEYAGDDLALAVVRVIDAMVVIGEPGHAVDRADLMRAAREAGAVGSPYALDAYAPLPAALAPAVRARAVILLRLGEPALTGKHMSPSAVAVACLAREAVEHRKCPAALWGPLLGESIASTTQFRYRDLVNLILRVAAPLPWAEDITRNNLVHFIGQICDLLEVGVIAFPGETTEAGVQGPSNAPAPFHRAERERRSMEARVRAAMARLNKVGVALPPLPPRARPPAPQPQRRSAYGPATPVPAPAVDEDDEEEMMELDEEDEDDAQVLGADSEIDDVLPLEPVPGEPASRPLDAPVDPADAQGDDMDEGDDDEDADQYRVRQVAQARRARHEDTMRRPRRMLDELDIVLESLLLQGVAAVQLRDMVPRDVLAMAEAEEQRQRHAAALHPANLASTELSVVDLSAAEEHEHLPFLAAPGVQPQPLGDGSVPAPVLDPGLEHRYQVFQHVNEWT